MIIFLSLNFLKAKIKNKITKNKNLKEDANTILYNNFGIYSKVLRNFFFKAKYNFFVTSISKIRQKLKIKILFTKLQILGETPFLTKIFNFFYENSPKQFF